MANAFRQTTLPIGLGSALGKRKASELDLQQKESAHTGSAAWCWALFTPVSPEDAKKHDITVKNPQRCNHCAADATKFKVGILTGANISRLIDHVLNRKACPFLASNEAQELAAKIPRIHEALTKQTTSSASTGSARSMVTMGFKPGVVSASEKARLDDKLLEMMVHCMFSFLAVENPHFVAMFAAIRPAYKLPTRRMVAGRLLIILYNKHVLQVKSAMNKTAYLHVLMDGWSRTQGADHLLGFCVVVQGITYFLDFLEVGDNSCNAEFLKSSFQQIVDKWDLSNKVASLITDTPSSMKACWRLLAADHPKLQCLGCWMHILNLTFKSICDESTVIKALLVDAVDLTNFFKRQQLNHSLLDKHRGILNIRKGLDEAGPTRFSFHFNVLDSLLKNKPALQAAVVDVNFHEGPSASAKQRAADIKKLVLDDSWWDRMDFIAQLLKPIKTAIVAVQADNCTQGDCLFIWRKMSADLNAVAALNDNEDLAPEVEAVTQSMCERFEYGFSTMMVLSALLHPKYRHRDREISMTWRNDAEYLVELLGSRVLLPNPSRDKEVLKRQPYVTDAEGKLARAQFWKYRTRKQDVGMLLAPFEGPEVEDPQLWWGQYGDECKELQQVALRCFPPGSAAGGERVFSALSNQWTRKRSTLSMCKANMLTYVFFNARAMAREDEPRLDWAAFCDSLEQEDEEDGVAVAMDPLDYPDDRAAQAAMAEQMAMDGGDDEALLTQEH